MRKDIKKNIYLELHFPDHNVRKYRASRMALYTRQISDHLPMIGYAMVVEAITSRYHAGVMTELIGALQRSARYVQTIADLKQIIALMPIIEHLRDMPDPVGFAASLAYVELKERGGWI